uniref:Uncharacterized protein n=1 Tax=Strix occidentalis caurina TaxID=311401 RepID=A0A8D0FRP9_STROC
RPAPGPAHVPPRGREEPELEGGCHSTSVEHLIINPNAAYEKFRDKRLSTKGVDFSDRINKPRTTGYESGEYEIVSPEGCGCAPPSAGSLVPTRPTLMSPPRATSDTESREGGGGKGPRGLCSVHAHGLWSWHGPH